MPIILTEYPKSGGSWIVSLLGEALEIPKRDIYVRPGFSLFDIGRHPWYVNGAPLDFPVDSVIKSHEPYNSTLIDFDATYVHLVRDGRDVITSKWFFDKDFLVRNGIVERFEKNFDEYVRDIATEWRDYVTGWLTRGVVLAKYEQFLENPARSLKDLIFELTAQTLSDEKISAAVEAHTKDKFSKSLGQVFQHNTFVRKGVAGDWAQHFSRKNIDDFNDIAGAAMKALGYTGLTTPALASPYLELRRSCRQHSGPSTSPHQQTSRRL